MNNFNVEYFRMMNIYQRCNMLPNVVFCIFRLKKLEIHFLPN